MNETIFDNSVPDGSCLSWSGAGVGRTNDVNYDFVSSNHCGTVLSGLNNLRTRQLLFDVALLVGQYKFRAHRVVLASCSEYFRAMFTGKMKEQQQNEIQLNDISPIGVQLLLDYAYTSKLTLNKENILVVLGAASHLQIFPVVDACARYLYSQIDLDNCVDIVTLAEIYTLPQLCHKAYCYISRRLDQLACMYEFQQLTGRQLEQVLKKQYPVDCSELEVAQAMLCWLQFDPNCSSRQLYATELLGLVNRAAMSPEDVEQLRQTAAYADVMQWFPHVGAVFTDPVERGGGIPDGLKNTRGFEPAIVNVGGFQGSTGMTNALMFTHNGGDQWSHLATTPADDMCSFGVAVLNNEIYVVGGCFNTSIEEDVHPLGYKYNVWMDDWTPIAPMTYERCNFYLGACHDLLYAVGGEGDLEGDNAGVLTCERYNPRDNNWTNIRALPTTRKQHSGCTTSTTMYISGGLSWNTVYDTLLAYDPQADTWTNKARMTIARADHSMTKYGNHLYVVGGWNEVPGSNHRTIHNTLDRYDIASDQWTLVTNTPTPRYLASVAVMNGKLYVIGGYRRNLHHKASKKIEVYDLDTDQWETHTDYPVTLWEHESCVIHVPIYRD